jgi:hypothetical protein
MELQNRFAVGHMPYRRQHEAINALEVNPFRCLIVLETALVGLYHALLPGYMRNAIFISILLVLVRILYLGKAEYRPPEPVDPASKNRGINSFTDEECRASLRSKKSDIFRLFNLSGFPHRIRYDNRTTCTGEYSFCLMLFRLAYPTRLHDLQRIFCRGCSQLSCIFSVAIDVIYQHHRDILQGNLAWYVDRSDIYHAAVLRKILTTNANPYQGFVPKELFEIFAYLDGTGLRIDRPVNGAQNPSARQ